MRNKSVTGLKVWTGILVLSSYLALYTVQDIGAMALIPPLMLAVLAPLGEWLDRRYTMYRTLTTAMSVACLVALPLFVVTLGLHDGVALLIMYIQAYELCHRKAPRNYYHIFLMSFFLLVSACVRSPEAGIALVMMMFLISAVWSFFLLQIVSATSTNERLVQPDIVPLHEKLLMVGSGKAERGVLVTAVMMSVACILFTALLFIATPRMEAGMFGRQQVTTQTQTGRAASVNLTQSGLISNNPTPVMQVTFPDLPEGRYDSGGPLYWRSHTLSFYNRRGWEHAAVRVDWDDESAPAFVPESRDDGTVFRYPMRDDSRVVRQRIYLDDSVPYVPALDLPMIVEAPAARVEWSESYDGTVELVSTSQSVLQYEAWSEVHWPTPEELRKAPSNYSEIADGRRGYLRMIDEDLEQRTRQLTRRITQDESNVYDKAVAIETYLSSGEFLYTTDLPPLPQQNAIDAFIWDTKIGHCELYATAMALMLRSLDIPTRIVMGYRGGEWDESDGSYIIRGDMAHVWLEVYFIGHGWVKFDPSPRSNEPRTMLGRLSRDLSRLQLKGKMFWYQNVVGFQSGFNLSDLRNLELRAIFNPFVGKDDAADEQLAADKDNGAMSWLIGIIGLSCVAFMIWRLYEGRSRHLYAMELALSQKRARRLYMTAQNSLKRRGLRFENVSSWELVEAARRRNVCDMSALERVVDTYNQVRFGERPLNVEDYRQLLKQARVLGAAKD